MENKEGRRDHLPSSLVGLDALGIRAGFFVAVHFLQPDHTGTLLVVVALGTIEVLGHYCVLLSFDASIEHSPFGF